MTSVMRFWTMVTRRRGNLRQRMMYAIIAVALRLFFRRIEAAGAEKVALDEPYIFVLNHPNGLIDAALVFIALPRRVSFLAKSTLFSVPAVSFMLRTLDALPLYRRVDAAANPQQAANSIALNQRTFAACFELLQKNRCIALFPEGVSHNSTTLLPLKTGAARIALGALSVPQSKLKTLKIMAVGLYYTSKTSFRSEALLNFGKAFEVAPVALDADGQPPREAVGELSKRIAVELKKVTLNVETNEALEVNRRTEALFSSVYESLNFRLSLSDELDLRRRFAAAVENETAAGGNLKTRLAGYDRRLRELGVAPEHLSVARHSSWFVFRHFLLRLGLILLLSPLVISGALIHLPAYLLSLLLSRLIRHHGVDDSGGTIKILAAIFLMPLTWLIITGAVFYYTDWRFAAAVFPLIIICGYAALRCLEELIDLRGWFAAVWILLRRRWLFIRLLRERRELHLEIENAVKDKSSRGGQTSANV